jgi:hypothetical protein
MRGGHRYADVKASLAAAEKDRHEHRCELGRLRGPRGPTAPRHKWSGTKAVFYWPDKLDKGAVPEELFWYAAYFLHLVRWRYVRWRANPEGFSQLLYSLLEKVIPRKTLAEVKRLLIGRGIVDCDNTSGCGKAFGYRLTPEYRPAHKIVCTDDRLNAAIERAYDREGRAKLPVHRWLESKLSLLTFDTERALAIIAKLVPDSGSPLTRKEYREQRREYCRFLADGVHWFTPDEDGRVHTPLTSLENELVCCLSVGGEPLVEIDVRNCQPLLLMMLVREWTLSTRMAKSRLLNRKFTRKGDPYHACNQSLQPGDAIQIARIDNVSIRAGETTTHQPPAIHQGKERGRGKGEGEDKRIKNVKRSVTPCCDRELWNSGPVTSLPPDLLDGLRVCQEGRFYEWLMTEEEKARGERYRDKFKLRFFPVLFGENPTGKERFPNGLRRKFEARCPTAADVLKAIKRKNHRQSSHLLQNLESTLVIRRICGRIMEERPGIPIYTKHDAILTTAANVPYVEQVIREGFGRLGVTPTLKKKSVGESCRDAIMND